jgi:hypothetical protein
MEINCEGDLNHVMSETSSTLEDYGFYTVKNEQLQVQPSPDTDKNTGQTKKCVESAESDTETSEYDFVIVPPGHQSQTLQINPEASEGDEQDLSNEDPEADLNGGNEREISSFANNYVSEDVSDEEGASDSLHSRSDSSAISKRGQLSGTRKRGRPRIFFSGDAGQDPSKKKSKIKKRGRPTTQREWSQEKQPKRSIGRPIKDPANERLRLRRMNRVAAPGLSQRPVGRPIEKPTNIRCLIQRQDSREKKLVKDCVEAAKQCLSDSEAQQLLVQVSKTKHGASSLSVFNKLSQTAEEVQQAKEVIKAVQKGVKLLSKKDSLLDVK